MNVVYLRERLTRVRGRMEQTLSSHSDPSKALADSQVDLEDIGLDLRGLRDFSPVLGELGDTLYGLARVLKGGIDQVRDLTARVESAGVHPAVAAVVSAVSGEHRDAWPADAGGE